MRFRRDTNAPRPPPVIDHQRYPTIMDAIISNASKPALLALRGTSRAVKKYIDLLLVRHITLEGPEACAVLERSGGVGAGDGNNNAVKNTTTKPKATVAATPFSTRNAHTPLITGPYGIPPFGPSFERALSGALWPSPLPLHTPTSTTSPPPLSPLPILRQTQVLDIAATARPHHLATLARAAPAVQVARYDDALFCHYPALRVPFVAPTAVVFTWRASLPGEEPIVRTFAPGLRRLVLCIKPPLGPERCGVLDMLDLPGTLRELVVVLAVNPAAAITGEEGSLLPRHLVRRVCEMRAQAGWVRVTVVGLEALGAKGEGVVRRRLGAERDGEGRYMARPPVVFQSMEVHRGIVGPRLFGLETDENYQL